MTKARDLIKPDDLTTVIVYDADKKVLWRNRVKAIPRVGDDILVFDQDKTVSYGAPVTDVVWALYENVAEPVVMVQLGSRMKP